MKIGLKSQFKWLGYHAKRFVRYRYKHILLILLAGGVLYLTSLYSYLLFHSLAEVFSVVIGISVFLLVWNVRNHIENNYLLFLGIAYLFIGGLDLLHMLAFTGMGVIKGYGSNLPVQLWIATRYLDGIVWVAAPFAINRKLKTGRLFLAFSAVVVALLASIFYWRIFPDCYINGALTAFKKSSELVICGLFLTAGFMLFRKKTEFEPPVLRLLLFSVFATILSELSFTQYASFYSFSSFLGHLFKISAYVLIYTAIVKTGFTQPYLLLLKDLKKSEQQLRKAGRSLEKRVNRRTAQLNLVVDSLQGEVIDRIRAEQALRQSEKKYRTLVECIPAITYIAAIDKFSTTTYVSPQIESILGFSPEDYKSDPDIWRERLHPDDKDRVLAELVAARETGKSFFSEYRMFTRNNRVVWFRDEAIIVRDDDNYPLFMQGIMYDISEQKQAEERIRGLNEELERRVAERTSQLEDANKQLQNEIAEHKLTEAALKRSEERYSLAQRVAGIGSWDWDIQTGKLIWSDQIEPMFGFKKGQFAATYEAFLQTIHPDDRQFVMNSADACLKNNENYAVEHRIVWPNGTVRWISEVGNVVRDRSGKAVRMLGIVQDTTERKHIEDQIKELNEKLEQRVLARTAELARSNELLKQEFAERENAELALRASETKFRHIYENLPVMMHIVDDQGKISDVNQKWLEETGYTREEVIGKEDDFVLAEESAVQHLSNGVLQFWNDGSIRDVPYQYIKKDSSVMDVLVDSVVTVNQNGKPITLSIARNVTDRRRLEREILEISKRTQRKIGQELHDGLGQHLTGIAFMAKVLQQQLESRSMAEAEDAARIVSLVNDAINQTRTLAKGLYPVEVNAGGLMSALQELAANTEKLFNIDCEFECSKQVLINDNSVAIHLYRIAQESVNNAVKHAHTNRVVISLTENNYLCTLMIRNNGRTFPDSLPTNKGMGLRIMNYRAHAINGSLDIRGGKNGGAVVTCVFPISKGACI